MIKGFSKKEMSKIVLGTHLGDVNDEVSSKYREAITFAIKNGIYSIDGAINYRGMRSEKDEGEAIRGLISNGKIEREDIFVASKAGLLFGDIIERLNPKLYLENVLKPQGITDDDFFEYDGLMQTLNPAFYEIALSKSLQNLGLETLDLHYIHIPEISRAGMEETDFYDRMEKLFTWYEANVSEGKVRHYGIALELMGIEPNNPKWHFELEEIKKRAEMAGNGHCHLKYVIFEYNIICQYPKEIPSQTVNGRRVTLKEACHLLGFKTVGSMPFAMGEALKTYSAKELLKFALSGVDHVIVGSKSVEHIQEILEASTVK